MSRSSTPPARLPLGVVGLALLVAAIWGFNFVVIKVGVTGLPPLFLAALRFVLSVFPAIFFVRKPVVRWGQLAAYGLFLGVGEFGLLFTAIKLGAPAGLSSIVLQSQAFLTAILAALFLREKVRGRTWAGLLIAAAGLVLLSLPQGGSGAALSPVLALMVLLAAFFWAAANIVAKRMPSTNAFGLMVYSSLFSPIPLFALSLLFDGAPAIATSLRDISIVSIGSIVYLAFFSTLVGYGIWNALIMRHGATRIAPFSLLVPIFSLSSAAIFLGEAFSLREAAAALLILAGLAVHVFGPVRIKGDRG
ncbi:MAG TPA: EamA family transporter [Rectinemataceae bacterium]|nr:EamA family transporter [Rectinemataceae bacterium]